MNCKPASNDSRLSVGKMGHIPELEMQKYRRRSVTRACVYLFSICTKICHHNTLKPLKSHGQNHTVRIFMIKKGCKFSLKNMCQVLINVLFVSMLVLYVNKKIIPLITN